MLNDVENIKLFHFPATRSARVRWALLETVGEGFELERVQLLKGEQFSLEYQAMNPNSAVPTLQISYTDGSVRHWIESSALVEWLVDAHPEKGLAPEPGASVARADYLQMLHFAGSSMDMMLWQIRLHEHLLGEDQADQHTVTRYREKIATEVEPQLAKRLATQPYICGDAFSGADILMGHNVFWARAYAMCQDAVFADYLARLAKRPAYREAFSDLK
ncbi:MAG: glutathione S-transferase family protein [Congregibacter sp.]